MKTLRLTSSYLLWLYAILPLCLVCVVIDALFLNYAMRDYLVSRPDVLSLWAFLFTLPHVIGSHVTLFDGEYARHYKNKIIVGLLISAGLAVIVRAVFGFQVFFFAIATYNMYHVLMQQYGISLMLVSKKPDMWFKGWKYLTLVGSTILYIQIFGGDYLSPDMNKTASLVVLASMVIAAVFALGLVRDVTPDKPLTGRWYLYATILMVFASWALYVGGYAFFAVLIPRFVHDVTAFSVYTVHDYNRNAETVKNHFYRALSFMHMSPAVLCVPLSIGLGVVLGLLQMKYPVTSNFNFTIVLLHYFMEGYIWKSGSPHRSSLPIIK